MHNTLDLIKLVYNLTNLVNVTNTYTLIKESDTISGIEIYNLTASNSAVYTLVSGNVELTLTYKFVSFTNKSLEKSSFSSLIFCIEGVLTNEDARLFILSFVKVASVKVFATLRV